MKCSRCLNDRRSFVKCIDCDEPFLCFGCVKTLRRTLRFRDFGYCEYCENKRYSCLKCDALLPARIHKFNPITKIWDAPILCKNCQPVNCLI